ncbi:hypothetical protein JCM8097_001705 [Rhodosporidiobolus ruineniae]
MVHLLPLLASVLALSAPLALAEPSAEPQLVPVAHQFDAAHQRVGHALAPAEHRRERRKLELEERAVNPKRQTTAAYYSAIVAVGASYTDNGHARASEYAGSLRDYYPYNKYGGKYTNGQVAVEYMAQSTLSPALKQSAAVKLLDYAYGGSVVQNGLSGTGSSWPAAKDQIATYLSDLQGGEAAVGAGRVLHYFNSGINPVVQIWNNALGAGLSSTAIANAKKAITANTQAYAAAIRTINTNSKVASFRGADFLLVGIPQMDLVPNVLYQIPSSYSTTKRAQAISLAQTLANQYNSELKTFAAALKKEAKNGGKVMYYDLAALWKSMHSSPKSYGITQSVSTACYNSATGGLCGNPQTYLYFDTLHPVTTIHKLMAQKMVALVNSS